MLNRPIYLRVHAAAFLVAASIGVLCLTGPARATSITYHEAGSTRTFTFESTGTALVLTDAVPLAIDGATADGRQLIVPGNPPVMHAVLRGKPVILVRGEPPKPPAGEPRRARTKGASRQARDDKRHGVLPKYVLHAGESVSAALSRWAAREGWQLLWEAPEVASRVTVRMGATLDEAITRTLSGISAGGTPLSARFYGGNRLVRVVGGRP